MRYRRLLSTGAARQLAVVSLIAKLAIGMFSISVLMLVSARYSYGLAGLAVGAMLLANAVTSPLRGRLADRRPLRVVLPVCHAGYLLGNLMLVMSVRAQASPLLPVLAAGLVGASFPPVSILLRAYWRRLTDDTTWPAANALESVLMDVALVGAPVVAAWLSTSVAPAAPFVAMTAVMTVAVWLMTRLPAPAPRAAGPGRRDRLGPLRSRPLLALLATQGLFCAALSATEVALPLYARQHDAAGLSGAYLAMLSVGSIGGALVLGGTRTPLGLLLAGFGASGMLLAIVMVTSPIAVLLCCGVSGALIGSVFAALFRTVGSQAPVEYQNEVQGWATSITQIGFSAGAVASSGLGGAYGSPAFAVVVAPAIVAALILFGVSTSLSRTPAAVGEDRGNRGRRVSG